MALTVVFNGETYEIPTTGEVDWGGQVSRLLFALSEFVRSTSHAESYPTVATLQRALNRMPLRLDEDGFVYLPEGEIVGATVSGFFGAGSLNLVGATSLATLATGYNSGTAGVGSESTSFFKPTGADNWTAGDLVDRFVKLTGGGGSGDNPTQYPVYRTILNNTTTRADVEAVYGMDSSTTFEIVDLVSEPIALEDDDTTSLIIRDNMATIVLRGIRFSTSSLDTLCTFYRNANVVVDGCQFANTANEVALKFSKCQNVTLSNCLFTDSADALVERTENVDIENVKMTEAGQIGLENCQSVEIVKLEVDSAVGQALEAVQVLTMQAEVVANDCGATPIRLESVAVFEAWGSNKLTGSGNTGYGLQIDKSGRYTLTGSDITGGTGDVLFMNAPATWALMSSPSYGVYEEYAASAIANSSYTKAIVRGPRLYEEGVDFSSRVLLYGYLNASSNLVVPTFSGSESYSMEANGVRSFLECICNSALATVILPTNAAIAGCFGGIYNRGSADLTVTSSGGGTVNGGASVTLPAGKFCAFFSLNGNSGKDFCVAVFP